MDTVYWCIGIVVVWIFVCLGIARFVGFSTGHDTKIDDDKEDGKD